MDLDPSSDASDEDGGEGERLRERALDGAREREDRDERSSSRNISWNHDGGPA